MSAIYSPPNMNFYTMEIGDKNTTRVADSDGVNNGETRADPDDWLAFESSDTIQQDPPTNDTLSSPTDPEASFDTYSDNPLNDVALNKTVSADRIGSGLTTQTALSDDPEQPTISDESKTTRKQSKWNCVLCLFFAFLLLAIAGALGLIVYIKQFHKVEQGTVVPTDAPSVSPTMVPTYVPTPSPTINSSGWPSVLRTPRPTTRRPTSRPTRSPSRAPSGSPTIHPTGVPSFSPTSASNDFRTLIAKITDGKTLQAVDRPGTPQQKAYEWIVNDPGYFEFKERRIVQRFVMAVLYYSTVRSQASRDAMVTWMDYETNECTWFTSWYENRVGCGIDDVFKTLALRNVELTGTIPSELALMTHLNTLVLSDNMLTGTLPKEFGQWESLIKLDVHSNFIGGPIPEWTNAPSLQELNIGSNRFSGNIPSSIANLNLTSLDLAENILQGLVPTSICQKSSQISLMTVDCDKVTCFCCTQCGASQTRAPAWAPFTPPPSPPPTRSPTMFPTSYYCKTAIQATKSCYKVGEPIEISFSNCNPRFGDWIGLYDAENPVSLLLNPLLWHRSCGSQSCSASPIRGSFTLGDSAIGDGYWPLSRGNYKVYLIRNGSTYPYQPVVGSEQIRVAQSVCPD